MTTTLEPTTPVGSRWIAALSLATLGMSVAVLTPIQVLLPLQIESIDPLRKVENLGWITTVAAIVSIIVCPIAGALSDRTRSRFGMRRPWVLFGALLGAAALTVLGAQDTIIGVAVWWVLVQTAANTLYAALSASIPDQVPVSQRGTVSAWVGLPLPLALIVGTFLVSTVVTGRFSGYLLMACLLVALVLPFLFTRTDAAAPQASTPFRVTPDLAWAFGCRFAIQLANAVGTLYLLYYLRDVVHHPDPAQAVFLLIALYTAGIVLTSVIAGKWSDRVGRRKPFVVVSSLIIAAAMVVLGVGQTWETALLAAPVMGIGYGVYIAVDNALITQVLPSAAARGRDLGIVNIANTAPQAVAPAIAGIVITVSGGYLALYLLAGVCALVGAALIRPVASVS